MHHHNHNHSAAIDFEQGNQKAFITGIFLNLAFVLAEVVAGIIYNSMSLLTDAGHNAGDVISLVLSFFAFWMAKKRSTSVYTYGYKKTTVLAALVNAVILLVAIGILGFESVTRLLHPQPVEGLSVAWVAGIGIIINSVSAYLFYKSKEKDLNSKAAYLHLLADALVSVAVVVAGIVMSVTHWYWLDPALGLVIMVVILIGTWGLLRDSFRMSVDAVPSGMELDKIKDVILNVNHVTNVEHVHVWSISTMENALTAHVNIDQQLSFDQKLNVIKEIKHELFHHNIHHSTIELS